jgi:hypothetical protein
MTTVYEDNFGFWEIDCPEESAFFEHIRSQSVRIICQRCKRRVRLIPTKTICAACVSAVEFGAPASMKEYSYGQATLLDPRHPSRRLLRPRVR